MLISSIDRRSIAVEPGYDNTLPFSPDDVARQSPQPFGGITRSQTVVRRDGTQRNVDADPQPSPLWAPDFAQLPVFSEQQEGQQEAEGSLFEGRELMSQYQSPSKTSSDSGQSGALDRWSQRRLQRLNTEQGFREQRQGGQPLLYSPQASLSEQQGFSSAALPYTSSQEPQTQIYHQQAQPHPSQPPTYQSERTSHTNAGPATQTQPVSTSQRSPNYQRQESSSSYGQQQQPQRYSPPDPRSQFVSQDSDRPQLPQSRSYTQQQPAGAEDSSMSSSNNGSLSAPKASRSTTSSNRQSMHNGLNSREGAGLGGVQQQQIGGQGVPAFSASVVPPTGQAQAGYGNSQQKEMGRNTPQPLQSGEEMSEEDVAQLIKEHKELRTLSQWLRVDIHQANTCRRREIHQSQEVLLRERGPSQAIAEQPRASTTITITNITRRQRIQHTLQSTRWPRRTASL